MSSAAVEVIDLTDAPLASTYTQEITSDSASPSKLGRRERRRLAAEARQNEPSLTNSSNSAAIVISEDDEQRSAAKDADASIKRKKRKRNRKDKVLEDGEIVTPEVRLREESGIDTITGLGDPTTPRPNGASNGRQSDTRTAANGRVKSWRKENMRRRSPSPPLFYIDDKPAEVPKPLEGKNTSDTRENGLLLPDHVHLDSTFAGTELDATILPDSEEDDDFIYFVDEDRIVSFVFL